LAEVLSEVALKELFAELSEEVKSIPGLLLKVPSEELLEESWVPWVPWVLMLAVSEV